MKEDNVGFGSRRNSHGETGVETKGSWGSKHGQEYEVAYWDKNLSKGREDIHGKYGDG